MGVLGLALLVASVVLAVTLPKEDILAPQFLVTFQEDRVDFLESPSHHFDTTEAGKRNYFDFPVPHDNVMQIQVNVHFEDDLPASDPDRFQVELYDPDGNRYGAPQLVANPMPQPNATTPGQYDAARATATLTYSFMAKPDDTVVEGDLNATEADIAREHDRLHRFNTNGTWRLYVVLVDAGGCPDPTLTNINPDDALRRTACLQANSEAGPDAARDAGNLFTVGSFSYVHFTVLAERLE